MYLGPEKWVRDLMSSYDTPRPVMRRETVFVVRKEIDYDAFTNRIQILNPTMWVTG